MDAGAIPATLNRVWQQFGYTTGNSIKSACRVKYRTEKDHMRGAALSLLVTRGPWVPEILISLGV
jgi:hypothetical protein